jgi:GAF domain-containing protein
MWIATEPAAGDEQAALRRVATLVADGATADRVMAAVADEVALVLDVPSVILARYELGLEATVAIQVLASVNEGRFVPGSRWPLDGPSVAAAVLQRGEPARIDDYSELEGSVAAGMRDSGVGPTVGVPIVVDGRIWGVTTVGAASSQELPPGTESRLSGFTTLVAIVISHAESRAQLRVLLEEQAALRRVATLVAEGASADELFGAVAAEVKPSSLPANTEGTPGLVI